MFNKNTKSKGASVVRQLLVWYQPYRLLLIFGFVATIMMAGTDSLFAYYLKNFVDKGVIHADPYFIRLIPLGIILIASIRAATSVASRYCMSRVSNSVIRDLRLRIFEKLLVIPAKEYDHTSTGTLLSSMLYNTGQVVQAGLDTFVNGLRDAATAVGLLVVLFLMSWKLTFILMTCGPFIAWLTRWASRRMRKFSVNVQDLMGELTHCTEENIKNYKMVRIYGGEAQEHQRAQLALHKTLQRQLKMVITNSLSVGLVPLLVCMPMALIFWLYSGDILTIGAGAFVSFMTSLVMIIKPIRRVVGFNAQIQQGLAGADAILQLLHTESEPDSGVHCIQRVQGAIEYRDVSFAYTDSPRLLIKNISFSVAPGQVIALVGRSGSGKTTLTNLLPRFYQLTDGDILLDGVSIADYSLKNLRSQFSLVSQQVTLFDQTIAYNITYGLEQPVSDAQVIAAAEAAYAMEFIADMPEGIHTMIGENGVLLSGGQRQRIAIARAILRAAPITILDEATSALDTQTERYIQAALQNLMQQSTSLVIAHRLSTIEHADKILVIEDGRLVEQGTHQDLLEQSGVYNHLYDMQFASNQPSTIT